MKKQLILIIIASVIASLVLLLQPLNAQNAQEQASQQTTILSKAEIYNKNFFDKYSYDLEVRLGKNLSGAEQLEVRLADGMAGGSVPIQQFTRNISGSSSNKDTFLALNISKYGNPNIEINFLKNGVYIEKNTFHAGEIKEYNNDDYVLVFARDKTEDGHLQAFSKFVRSLTPPKPYMPSVTESTVKIRLNSMTSDEEDSSDTDCAGRYENLYYDKDYDDEEYRPIFTLGFPERYRQYIPNGAIITRAVFYVYYDEEEDSGKIRHYISYSQRDSDCDSCMDWDDAYSNCDIDSGDSLLGIEDSDDNKWVSYDITSYVKEAFEGNKFVAFYMKGSSSSASGDVEQDFAGESHSSLYPYVEITYSRQCDSGVCCDPLGRFLPSAFLCNSNEAAEYDCPWGSSPGMDVGKRIMMRYCRGSSPNCDGPASWLSWSVNDDCSSNEYCSAGNPNCLACSPNSYSSCSNNDLYWYDSCGRQEGIRQDCGENSCSETKRFCGGSKIYKEISCYDRGCSGNSCYSNPKVSNKLVEECQYGCENAECIAPQCTSGLCCQNYKLKPSSEICAQDVEIEYGCPFGTELGNDLMIKAKNQYCNGSSADCTGEMKWSDWGMKQDCSMTEACVSGQESCRNMSCSSDADCAIGEECLSNICTPIKPLNPSISLLGQNIWSYEGYLSAKQAINFEQQLNDALSECQPDEEGYCTISIDVISDSESKITISDIKIDYINTEDRDNDGVEDKQDTVIGDITEIDTNIPELAIAVGNRDITDNYDVIGTPPESQQSVQKIEVKERDKVLVEFDMDLSQKKLYLSSLVIKKQEPDADKGAIVVSGITLDEQETKIIYIDKIDSNSSGVCIKDEEVLSISEISSDCKGQSEVFVSCNDIDVNGYSCIEETQRYKITGLKHSAAIQSSAEYDNDGDGYYSNIDCDDGNTAVNPAAIEECNGIDDDCDDKTDEDLAFPDGDKQDGLCTNAKKVCGGIEGWLEPDYSSIKDYESSEKSCDGLDNDCDGTVDEDIKNSYY